VDGCGKRDAVLRYCTKEIKKRTIPNTPFSETGNRDRNALKSAYHAQSKIGWENLVKRRTAQEWFQFMETNYVNQGYTLKARDWSTTFTGDLWEHTERVCKFRNSIYHADQTGRIARYKREDQQRRMDKIWTRHLELQGRLRQNQIMYFEKREHKDSPRYDSQRCWALLVEMYLQEAESPSLAEHNALAQYLVSRYGVG
jgi:hypothetical protein